MSSALTKPASGTARPPRHFLDIKDHDAATLRRILDTASAWTRAAHPRPLAGRTLALIFGKPSTRTRVSFEVAMRQLGGDVIVLSGNDMQLGRGESIADTARVMSRYVDAIMLRTDRVAKMEEMAAHAAVPVINGLTERSHPCQVLADIMTFEQHLGPIAGQKIAWVGDANNVARSWIEAAAILGFTMSLATPSDYAPPRDLLAWAAKAGAKIETTRDPAEAVAGARCVLTDVWVSMADEDADRRRAALSPYQVNTALMQAAAADAIFMHCLPAHRGEEVAAEVIDGPQSVVWDEAENRLHVQKAILAWVLRAI